MDYVNWGYYESGLDVPEFVLRRLVQVVSGFDRYRRANRWLDVGCGAGTLMRAASSEGWDVVGTEVAPAAANAVRAAGLDVRTGVLADLDLPRAGFDVVSVVEVIEHVPDPVGLLAESTALVRPGGAVYLTTPHGRGISARLLGTRWSVVCPPDHLQLFSDRGLEVALRRTGLVTRSVRTHAVNPYELVAAMRTKVDGQPFAARTESSYRLNEALSSSTLMAFAKASINVVLSTTRLGDKIKVVAEREDNHAEMAP